MTREIGKSGFGGTNPLNHFRRAERAATPTSADAAERRARMNTDRGQVAGGHSRSAMSLGNDRAQPRRNTRDFDRFLLNQNENGRTNGCGTTSMSMVLNYWKNDPKAYSREMVDEQVRRGPDMFSSPQNLIDYARDQGFRSEGQNGSSLEDLKSYLDQGVPVQVLIDPDNDGGDSVLHYVDVVDYQTDDDGQITDLVIADPAGGDLETMPVEEFEEKWGDLHLEGVDTGIENLMIVTLPGENTPVTARDGSTIMSDDIDLPPQAALWERVLGVQFGAGTALADGISDVVNDGAEVVDTVADAGGAVVDTVADAGGAVVDGAERVGSWLNPFG